MATRLREENLIDELASQFRQISGIKNAYDFAANPDTLTNAQLPAVLFMPTEFDSGLRAHHNRHRNQVEITAVLFVTPRESMGGSLKFIENAAIPYLSKIRQHFQTKSVIQSLFRVGNLTEVTSFSGTYGAGGLFLTHNGVEYLGCILRWQFIEII
jgi:hypothetical protein